MTVSTPPTRNSKSMNLTLISICKSIRLTSVFYDSRMHLTLQQETSARHCRDAKVYGVWSYYTAMHSNEYLPPPAILPTPARCKSGSRRKLQEPHFSAPYPIAFEGHGPRFQRQASQGHYCLYVAAATTGAATTPSLPHRARREGEVRRGWSWRWWWW